ncbi:hypothetical protein JYU34_018829 [Plutella xylostella]|uniref:Uracil-DNA glycosylase-like domain-containing protein n=1 Tax=Plutella xylostella TaxID=51655 RepID=A0ABQ7PYU5_PLUXY|nr:hypothetical protein JYU34_018829 [Plutella xylostella]
MEEDNVVSSFFVENAVEADKHETIPEDFLDLIDELNIKLSEFQIPSPVECVYNPTLYARQPFEMYIRNFCNSKKKIMYFGMNPGPWGMSQTGVPFGEVNLVRDWLGINGPVGKPEKELKARPVNGFGCTRSEISGKRFWNLFKSICGVPQNFFQTSFVYNYLPQQWLKSNGCNVTPGDFKASQMQPLYDMCDPTFIKVLKLYDVQIIVAIGKFCETRAKKAVEKHLPNSSVQIYYLPHPSPRTVNNNDWDKKAIEHLNKYNLIQYYNNSIKTEEKT